MHENKENPLWVSIQKESKYQKMVLLPPTSVAEWKDIQKKTTQFMVGLHSLNNLENTKFGEFLFFSCFFFLISVVFLGGIWNTGYFFLHLEHNTTLLILPKIIWVFLVVFQLTFPSFGRNLVNLLYDQVFLEWFTAKLLNFRQFLDSNPLGFFLFIHLLLCFSVLHLLMVYVIGIDLPLEFIYQCLNGLKLIFLVPLAIYTFLFVNGRMYGTDFPHVTPESYENLKKTIVKVGEDVAKVVNKNPRTSKAFVGGAAVVGVAATVGKLEKDKLRSAESRYSSRDLDPEAVVRSPELQQMQEKMIDLERKGDESMVGLGAQVLSARLKRKPSASQELIGAQKEARTLQNSTLSQISKEKAEAEERRNQILLDLKHSKQANLGQNTQDVVNYTVSSSSPEVPSCLETSWSLFGV